MEKASRSDRLEDNRFKEIKRLKKKHIPHRLHWYLDEDYFSEELLGIYTSEIEQFRRISEEAFYVFEKATQKLLSDNQLSILNIPSFFEDCIRYSWENKAKHPFLYGRFDINGGLKNTYGRIIEFNADTCSTLPETMFWQPLQLGELKGKPYQSFNSLRSDIEYTLSNLKVNIPNTSPVLLGSSFGYEEDILNVNSVLDIANDSGFKPFYTNLEHVIFSDEGIFYAIGNEYQQVDVWFKMVPWDWMFYEEPELAKTLSDIIINDKATVLNPAYTAIWQNKKFLAYITKHFPNNAIAETYLQPIDANNYVKKPVYGRLGENINIKFDGVNKDSKGDFGNQDMIYQKYYPLHQDMENYNYQTGMFYTHKASAINLRAQESLIITDDCEFMSHFII